MNILIGIKNMLSPKAWIQGVLFKKVFSKLVKGASAAVLGLATAGWFTDSVQPILNKILDAFGGTLTPDQISNGITVLVAGALMAVWNWLVHGPLKNLKLAEALPIKGK